MRVFWKLSWQCDQILCSDILFEAQGLCLYCLDKPSDALASFKKMQIDSIAGLFYQALCYQELKDTNNAGAYLNMAISER